jgi:hypothetical protein
MATEENRIIQMLQGRITLVSAENVKLQKGAAASKKDNDFVDAASVPAASAAPVSTPASAPARQRAWPASTAAASAPSSSESN